MAVVPCDDPLRTLNPVDYKENRTQTRDFPGIALDGTHFLVQGDPFPPIKPISYGYVALPPRSQRVHRRRGEALPPTPRIGVPSDAESAVLRPDSSHGMLDARPPRVLEHRVMLRANLAESLALDATDHCVSVGVSTGFSVFQRSFSATKRRATPRSCVPNRLSLGCRLTQPSD
jgi:hypothetical protein